MRQIQPRVFQLTYETRTFDAEAGIAEVLLHRAIESHAIDTSLIKIEHVFTITFTIGDDFQAETGLVLGCPADILVDFLLTPTGPLHGIGDLLLTRVTAYNGIAKWFGHNGGV